MQMKVAYMKIISNFKLWYINAAYRVLRPPFAAPKAKTPVAHTYRGFSFTKSPTSGTGILLNNLFRLVVSFLDKNGYLSFLTKQLVSVLINTLIVVVFRPTPYLGKNIPKRHSYFVTRTTYSSFYLEHSLEHNLEYINQFSLIYIHQSERQAKSCRFTNLTYRGQEKSSICSTTKNSSCRCTESQSRWFFPPVSRLNVMQMTFLTTG